MERKDYIQNIDGAERRFFTARPELRMEENEETSVVRGIAARVNDTNDLGWFKERIAPGAFDRALNSADLDCRCLFNHDANMILARKNSRTDTLKLFLTEEGHLAYEFKTPNRSYAKDLADAIASGDVDQSSFAWRIVDDSWEYDDDNPADDLRTITSFHDLMDVSPVTYPAYQNTAVTVDERNHQEARSAHFKKHQPKKSRSSDAFDEFDAQFMFNQNNS